MRELPLYVVISAWAIPALVLGQFAMLAIAPLSLVVVGTMRSPRRRELRWYSSALALLYTTPLFIWARASLHSSGWWRPLDMAATTFTPRMLVRAVPTRRRCELLLVGLMLTYVLVVDQVIHELGREQMVENYVRLSTQHGRVHAYFPRDDVSKLVGRRARQMNEEVNRACKKEHVDHIR